MRGPRQGRGQLRAGVRARRAVLRAGHRPGRPAAAELRRRQPAVRAGRGRATRCASATRPAPSDFGWAGRDPAVRVDARRPAGWSATGWPGSPSAASRHPARPGITLSRDGTARVRSAATDIGTGTYTVATQLTAELLGLRTEPGRRRDRRQRPAARAPVRRVGSGDGAERSDPRRRRQPAPRVPRPSRRRRVAAARPQPGRGRRGRRPHPPHRRPLGRAGLHRHPGRRRPGRDDRGRRSHPAGDRRGHAAGRRLRRALRRGPRR